MFLTHDWGVDGEGRNNHDRVAMINTLLKSCGFNTWFDEERMTGHIVQQMCRGIDGSQAVLVFITKRYVQKTNSEHDDNCKKVCVCVCVSVFFFFFVCVCVWCVLGEMAGGMATRDLEPLPR